MPRYRVTAALVRIPWARGETGVPEWQFCGLCSRQYPDTTRSVKEYLVSDFLEHIGTYLSEAGHLALGDSMDIVIA